MRLLSRLVGAFSVMLATNFSSGEWMWVNDLTSAIETFIAPALGVVASAGCIYAIILAVQMARADTADKREEAKKRMIGIIIAVIVLVILIVVFYTLLPMILEALLADKGYVTNTAS